MAMAFATSLGRSTISIGSAAPAPAPASAQRGCSIRCKGLSLEIQKCRSSWRGIQPRLSSRLLAMAEDESSVATAGESAAEVTEAPSESPDYGKNNGESGDKGDEAEAVKPRVVYPKGFTRYETMAVLRPDITEEQRLALSQRYEEMIIAGGGMDVEIFNRGIMPLAYGILKKNTRGEKNTYVDGIFYMFTFATKPGSVKELQRKLETDDDIIRVTTFKIK